MNPIEKLKSLPLVSYLRRYWWVVVLLYFGYVMARSESIFAIFDVFAYLPLCFVAWVALVLLWRNIFNSGTTDAYVDRGGPREDFKALTGREKLWYTMIQTGFYLIGGAIITGLLVSNALF